MVLSRADHLPVQLGAVEEMAGEEGLMGWMIAAGGDGAGESQNERKCGEQGGLAGGFQTPHLYIYARLSFVIPGGSVWGGSA